MTALADLIAGRTSGVYRWRGDASAKLADLPSPPKFVAIDIPETKAVLLTRIAVALGFPGWFGENWDALADCLADLPLAEEAGVVIELQHLERLAAAEPESVRTLIDIFREAAADWATRGGFVLVLAEGGGKLTAELARAS